MQLQQLLYDDDAVSPVIGVTLMVAITVILAAVIGTFVLDLGDQVQTTALIVNIDASRPDTSVATDSNVTLPQFEITGGQNVDAETLAITHNLNGTSWSHLNTTGSNLTPHYVEGLSGTLSAGDTITLTVESSSAGDVPLEGEEVNLVWQSEGQSQVLSTVELEDIEVTSP